MGTSIYSEMEYATLKDAAYNARWVQPVNYDLADVAEGIEEDLWCMDVGDMLDRISAKYADQIKSLISQAAKDLARTA